MSVEPSVSDRDPDAPILIGHHHGWLDLPDLPAPTTPPFGREDAIHTVLSLARDPNVRLVTLTGLGGIGKTRLAIAVAQELGCSVDVADADSDGLPDTCEAEHGSDPGKPDGDGDGPSDGDEVDKHKSDPTKFDTDGDNLTDFDEVMEHGSSPTRVDSDGDDLRDGNEVNQYNTDRRTSTATVTGWVTAVTSGEGPTHSTTTSTTTDCSTETKYMAREPHRRRRMATG